MNLSAWKSVILLGSLVGAFLFGTAFQLLLVRNDISDDAKQIARLEYRLLKAQDALRALEVNVDDSVQPHVLRARIEGVLFVPSEGQVLRVKHSEVELFNTDLWAKDFMRSNGKEGV